MQRVGIGGGNRQPGARRRSRMVKILNPVKLRSQFTQLSAIFRQDLIHDRLRRFPVVVLQHPAEALLALDGVAPGRRRWLRRREEQQVILALMIPLLVIVHDELVQGSPEPFFPEWDDPRQTFLSHASHVPFGVGVGRRCRMHRIGTVREDASVSLTRSIPWRGESSSWSRTGTTGARTVSTSTTTTGR